MATSKVIELIVKAKDQASKTLDDISKNTEKLNNSLKEVRQISTVATTALVALWGVMVNDAAKTEPVQKAFDWLAESIGENSKRRHPVYLQLFSGCYEGSFSECRVYCRSHGRQESTDSPSVAPTGRSSHQYLSSWGWIPKGVSIVCGVGYGLEFRA